MGQLDFCLLAGTSYNLIINAEGGGANPNNTKNVWSSFLCSITQMLENRSQGVSYGQIWSSVTYSQWLIYLALRLVGKISADFTIRTSKWPTAFHSIKILILRVVSFSVTGRQHAFLLSPTSAPFDDGDSYPFYWNTYSLDYLYLVIKGNGSVVFSLCITGWRR